MKLPVCEICLRSTLLCNACKGQIEKNKISENEIKVLKFLYELSDKIKSLDDVRIAKIVDSDIILIISGKGDGAKLVGKGGSVVKALAKQFGKSIRVIEEEDDFKGFLQKLFSPVPIIGVNTIFTPDGEMYKVRISESNRGKIHIPQDTFSQIIENMYSSRAELAFE